LVAYYTPMVVWDCYENSFFVYL